MRISRTHLAISLLCLPACAAIALGLGDARFIRGFAGDVVVVMLIFNAVRSFFAVRASLCALCTLAFAFAVEVSQAFHLIELLGLESSPAARLVLGTTFDHLDLVAYSIGCGAAWSLDRVLTAGFERLPRSCTPNRTATLPQPASGL